MLTDLRTDIDVRSRTSGEQRRFSPGQVVQLRRDPTADFPVLHERISRSSHADLAWVDGHGWVLRDLTGRAGVILNGVPQQSVLIDRPTLVRLGSADAGEDLEISPVAVANPQPAPAPAYQAALSAQTVVAPSARVGAAWRLAVTVAGDTLTFDHQPIGRPVTIGRDPSCDVTVDNPTVSRYHASLVSVPEGWRYDDRSTGGSWQDGKRRPTVQVDRTTELKLGDPLTGVPLRLEVSTPPEVERRRERRSRSVKIMAGAGAVAIIAAIATVLALVVGGGTSKNNNPTPPGSITPQTLLAVEQATVKLDIVGADGESSGWGSGSIIDPHGMILTNSHVADPNAVGLDTQYGAPLGEDNPAYLIVDMRGTGPDGNVVAKYRARKVVSDGYLDLAVVQIYADAAGHPVDPSTLNLPTLKVGDSNNLAVGDEVAVVGFPGVSQSRSATVTKGNASAFVQDERLHSDRGWIETTARIAHGNSGGAAVNASGELVGVPTRIAPEHEGDVGWWFRPVNWANKLISLARNHQGSGYVTPYVTPASGVTITPLGWSADKNTACDTGLNTGVAHAPGGTGGLYLGVQLAGLQKGLDFNAQINGPAAYQKVITGTSSGPQNQCFYVPVIFGGGDGRYYVDLSVDPPGNSTKEVVIAVGDQ